MQHALTMACQVGPSYDALLGWCLRYLAHEILDGDTRQLDKGDMFALGASLYELASGCQLPKGAQTALLKKPSANSSTTILNNNIIIS